MSPGPSGLEGRLDEVGFADLLRLLRSSGQEGVLRLEDETEVVVAVAREGVLLAASGGETGLRQAVLGGGLLGAPGWDRAMARLGSGHGSGRALELLVEEGADPERLRARLYELTVSTIFELLLPSAASFRFTPGESHPFAVQPGFPFEDVLTDVSSRVAEWKEIAAAIPSTSVVLRRAARLPAASGPITLTPEEFELLGLLDGRREVTQLVQRMGISAFGVMTSLHRLMALGAAEPVRADQEPSA